MTRKKDVNCIVLCGGKGTRMQSETKHKVCFEIDGKPSILHTLGNFEKAGVNRFVVVVGALSGQVTECVGSEYPRAAFVYQKEQKGTGNAAKAGFSVLEAFNVDGPVIITMGDKITSAAFIEKAARKYAESRADLLVCAQPKSINPTGGRIVFNKKGCPVGIREEIDTKRALLYKKVCALLAEGVGAEELQEAAEQYAAELIASAKKRESVINELRGVNLADEQLIKERAVVKIGGAAYDPGDVDASAYTNASVYILSPKAARFALPLIGDDNAQNEEYLTDIVEILASGGRFRVAVEAVDDEWDIMSFNNVEELLKIEAHYRNLKAGAARLPGLSSLKPVGEWIDLFENPDETLLGCLAAVYGGESDIIAERTQAVLGALRLFASRYGAARSAVISRAPGRVNLMGRHIDHRGGNVNVMSINKEVIAVCAARDDDRIRIANTADGFPPREFAISDHLAELDWDSWLGFLESGEAEKLLKDTRGDWANYIKAPVLRLQYQFRDRKLKGMDMAFTGNIPIAAGLSSSSAIVVSTAEAFCALNGIELTPRQFVELCGEGEWYVGSRGGAADHAAMKFAERGCVAKLGFFPFEFRDKFAFPDECKLIIANSHIRANKTTNARDAFNSRVAAFEFGAMLFRDAYPQYAGTVAHLRDINPGRLGVSPSKIYELIAGLPEKAAPGELFSLISEANHEKIRSILATHNPPENYPIRAVCLYGIAECARSSLCKSLFDDKKIGEFGRLMTVSHDGDRVVCYDETGERPYTQDFSDAALRERIDSLRSEDPERVKAARLENLPGGYACSVPEIDFIVDKALGIPGVLGAQISGAGLGGCVMILAENEVVSSVFEELERVYYKPRGLAPDITVCVPVKGSGILEVGE